MRTLAALFLAVTLAAPALAARPDVPPRLAYVLGRYAYLDHDVERAAQLLESARLADPASASIRREAWELAVAAGDQNRAFRLAQALGSPDAEVMITRLSDAVLRRDWAMVQQLRAGLGNQGWPQVAGPVIDAWARFAMGDSAGALAVLEPARAQGFMRAYLAEQRAHMLVALGRWDDAAAAFRQVRGGSGPATALLRQAHADALVMAGRKDEALALLFPSDRPTAVARQRLAAGKRLGPLAPDARSAIGWLYLRLSDDLARERAEPLALLFARLASFLMPEQPLPWLAVGDHLGRSGQNQAALAALARVPAGLGLDELVRSRRADILEAMGAGNAAGDMLRAAAAAPGASVEDLVGLAAWHQRAGRHADAALAYGTAIDRYGASLGATAWNLHYLRAIMRDRAGDWPGAQADLKAALALFPDEAGVLNYLGYTLMERGEQMEEAQRLIETAARLRPGDGGIVDSLGWLQLKLGRVDEAVATLERALALEPEDPTLIGHLGDALWQQGRRIEARFRWRQALGIAAEADEKRRLQARLDYGLDAAPAMLAQR
ncbi:MAG: tetratricopeptide repeat protein [Alphaproteobacteria bacterium]|nr:tetratricopeptide repeat protein [Alphaproteobacteria bacterium]